ncbi:transcriptional regulator, GntR family [Anaerofustis stercorihominis DSM 17244]|uniref:Transcriptional regulator, GntR family n=1 Tax=Anaerofustis stercorihominis DSM 17244 TaxID=445971 RepID=B1CAD8_9FIRM|nr:GntR family transcriptional regulator [Anaerofustis stercorihominis]EDS72649.1 transcriptional regulator, GntR family [Anaerofustis stercorihominis DSM 17244]
MEIILKSGSDKPIYEQITSQIKSMIIKGELREGDALPSMRKLAKELHISVITSQRVYEDLQRDGFIESSVGKGTFVSAQNKDFIREENLRKVENMLEEVVQISKENNITKEELIKTLSLFYEEE